MKTMIMYDKYENKYRNVVDVEELKEYIQDVTAKIKNEKAEDMFITASQGKLDTIIVLDKILEELKAENEN